MYSTESKNIAVRATTAEYLQVAGKGNKKLFSYNNYNDVNILE